MKKNKLPLLFLLTICTSSLLVVSANRAQAHDDCYKVGSKWTGYRTVCKPHNHRLLRERDRLRRQAEDEAARLRQKRDRARREAEEAAKRARDARDRLNKSIREGQKNLEEVRAFQRNPLRYVRGKVSQYGPKVGYRKSNRAKIQRELASNGYRVIYAKKFGSEQWAKLTACLAGDVVGGGGSCTTTFVNTYAKSSYYKLLNGLKSEGAYAQRAFRKQISGKAFVKAMIKLVRDGHATLPQINGIDLDFGNATYNEAECLVKSLGGYCAKMPNSHQPYIRYRVRSNFNY